VSLASDRFRLGWKGPKFKNDARLRELSGGIDIRLRSVELLAPLID